MTETLTAALGHWKGLNTTENNLRKREYEKLCNAISSFHFKGSRAIGVIENDADLASIPRIDQPWCIQKRDAMMQGESTSWENQTTVTLR
jgi:hypothetical protein